MKIVFASNNQGKYLECKAFADTLAIELIPQSALGVTDVEETGLSFVENAITKARHASLQTHLPAIADDSGLIVDALRGAPGIHSARYAGIHATSAQNIEKLLSAMKLIPEHHRQAAFYCALVYIEHAHDPRPLICEGEWHGNILKEPVGTKGFGYDPVFFDPHENCSAALLSLDKKNKISHRGKALQQLSHQLSNKMAWKNT